MFVAALLLSRWQVGRWDGFVLGQNDSDQHWLWHVALLPFAVLGDWQALPWAAAFNAAAAVEW